MKLTRRVVCGGVALACTLFVLGVHMANMILHDGCVSRITPFQVDEYNEYVNFTSIRLDLYSLMYGMTHFSIHMNESCQAQMQARLGLRNGDPRLFASICRGGCTYWTSDKPPNHSNQKSKLLFLNPSYHYKCVTEGVGWEDLFMSWVQSTPYDWECYNYATTQCIDPIRNRFYNSFMDFMDFIVHHPSVEPKLDVIRDCYKYLVKQWVPLEEMKRTVYPDTPLFIRVPLMIFVSYSDRVYYGGPLWPFLMVFVIFVSVAAFIPIGVISGLKKLWESESSVEKGGKIIIIM